MTTVYASNGAYAPDHGPSGDDYAYYVFAPFQYNEDPGSPNGGSFVSYHAGRWDFAGAGDNAFTGDPEADSFDLGCAICHGAAGIETVNKGLPTERRVALFPMDHDGYSIAGLPSQMNVGCEKCHGPGSSHLEAGGNGRMIVSPAMLPPGRLAMICGACHIQGRNNADIGGRAPLLADGNGNYEAFRPGTSPARFFGTSDGTGRNVAPFGTMQITALTGEGFLDPSNLETDASVSWVDQPLGAAVNHSKANQLHYQDLVRTSKYRNSREILTCLSCHDAHGSSFEHMVSSSARNNALCLSCHNGLGPKQVFPTIDQGMADRLKNNAATSADNAAIGADVEAHIYAKTGTLQMAPYDPETTGMGRCTLCHMPKTARSADWQNALLTVSGQYRQGDISSHTFDVMTTAAVNAMGATNGAENTTPAGISHACGSCHRFAGLN